MAQKAIVLLSGGLDSTLLLALAHEQGFAVHAVTFDYGQRNRPEIFRARELAKKIGVVEHRVLNVDLRQIGGSSLTDDKIAMPKGQEAFEKYGAPPVTPNTYVPVRNLIFLAHALAWAEVIEAQNLYVGFTQAGRIDIHHCPDSSAEFTEEFEKLANVCTTMARDKNMPVVIHAPMMLMHKRDAVRLAYKTLGPEIVARTLTCFDPVPQKGQNEWMMCGKCGVCITRMTAFRDAGLEDPAPYADRTWKE